MMVALIPLFLVDVNITSHPWLENSPSTCSCIYAWMLANGQIKVKQTLSFHPVCQGFHLRKNSRKIQENIIYELIWGTHTSIIIITPVKSYNNHQTSYNHHQKPSHSYKDLQKSSNIHQESSNIHQKSSKIIKHSSKIIKHSSKIIKKYVKHNHLNIPIFHTVSQCFPSMARPPGPRREGRVVLTAGGFGFLEEGRQVASSFLDLSWLWTTITIYTYIYTYIYIYMYIYIYTNVYMYMYMYRFLHHHHHHQTIGI